MSVLVLTLFFIFLYLYGANESMVWGELPLGRAGYRGQWECVIVVVSGNVDAMQFAVLQSNKPTSMHSEESSATPVNFASSLVGYKEIEYPKTTQGPLFTIRYCRWRLPERPPHTAMPRHRDNIPLLLSILVAWLFLPRGCVRLVPRSLCVPEPWLWLIEKPYIEVVK